MRLREPKDMPPAPTARESPYEPEARYGYKRGQTWRGYKVHLTETCDDEQRPHLLTNVATTIATASDMAELAAIHQGLARVDLLPGQHLVDTGYVRARNLLDSQQHYHIDLLGPTPADHQWQLKAQQGFDCSHFQVDWDQHVVRCPRGHPSAGWYPTHTPQGQPVVQVTLYRQRPDVVLLDLMMPGMDGWQFLEAEDCASLAIIVMSAAANVDTLTSSSNVRGFLPKPFDVTELIGAVGRAVAHLGLAEPALG